MKYIKLFSLLVATILFAACSDDKVNWNSASDVTVSMSESAVSYRESAGVVSVPIKVEGSANGMVNVTLETKEVGASPAKEGTHYYVTSKSVNISDGEGYVEIEFIDDKEINDDRTFEITIASAKGAKVGTQNTTVVTIRDNDKEPYDRVQGTWTMSFTDINGSTHKGKVTISGADDPSQYIYNRLLYLEGLRSILGVSDSDRIQLAFDYDTATNTCYVSFTNLSKYNWITGFEHSSLSEPVDVKLYGFDGSQSLSDSPIEGTVDSSFSTITFDMDATHQLAGVFTDPDTGGLALLTSIYNIVLTKE